MAITLTPKQNNTSSGGGIKLTPNVKNAPSLEQVKKFESDFKTKSKSKDELPLLTKSSGKFSKDLVTSGKDVAVGGLKSLVKGTIDVASGLQKFGQKFLTGITPGSAKNPEIAKNIQENTGFPSLKEETPQGKTVQNMLQPKSQAEKVGGIIETGAELATPLAGGNLEKGVVKGKELAKKTSDFFTSGARKVAKGMTKEEILATPEADLHKLSPTERKTYFDAQKEKVSVETAESLAKVEAENTKRIEQAIQETKDLTRDIKEASRDEVLRLRPKIIESMGKQSQTYRELVNAEMKDKAKNVVKLNDLETFIDTRYGDNPSQAASIKDKLGLIEETPKPTKKGEMPSIQYEEGGKTKTLGDIYDKTKALRSEISAGAKSGSKVFTAEDKATDDAIHTLMDFMKQKGVDFSKANKFWSEYAPIRNQLVVEAKPFLKSGTQTTRFANTLERVASGKDVNNENFIKEVENIVGEPIGADVKKAVEKLDEAQKIKVVRVAESEMQKANILAEKERTLKKLSDKQFEVNRKARMKDAIKKAFKSLAITGGGILLYEELKPKAKASSFFSSGGL